jgi:hypothetical protein
VPGPVCLDGKAYREAWPSDAERRPLQRRRQGGIDAVAASRTIGSEGDGFTLNRTDADVATATRGTARARRAGLSKAEPGAGSAGRGVAERRRLDSSTAGFGSARLARRANGSGGGSSVPPLPAQTLM